MPCRNKTGVFVSERCGRYQYDSGTGEELEKTVSGRGGNTRKMLPELLCLKPNEYRTKEEYVSTKATICQMDK